MRPLARASTFMITGIAGLASCQCGTGASDGGPASASIARGVDDPALPGLGEGSPALMVRLHDALSAKGPSYVPRTHHKGADGAPLFVNRLILETSPYLLQHAHNPVNWFPWGDEAFERARSQDKPVLLSIGYSTCHWCHVMERESFEDLEIARYLNEHFVCIKVDREERPDVDAVYMAAVQMLTGRGGWPMTTVLTPDRQPFFAGTYFPARDGDRGASKGLLTILAELDARYHGDRPALVAQAQALSAQLSASVPSSRPGELPGPEAIEAAAESAAQAFDPEHGGFGRAPKFPTPSRLELLLRYHRRAGKPAGRGRHPAAQAGGPDALGMVSTTLERMARGGIYDHVGGGFHRYSTDAQWLVPHFEKMLYDNAQLASVYLAAHQLTGREDFSGVVRDILDYVEREMTAPSGGFYSATDADSPGPWGHDEEGYYFTWTPKELVQVLGEDDAALVAAAYDVTEGGNFEGRSILHVVKPLEELATERAIAPEELKTRLRRALDRLRHARAERPPPARDEKVLTSWNGLMISAYARSGFALKEARYTALARRAARFVLSEMTTADGRLLRSHTGGEARHVAYLDDYAFFVQALLDLFESTSELVWLEEAIALTAHLDAHYLDEEGGYFATADDAKKLLRREKPSRDGAEPSGNAVAIINLLRLYELTQDDAYRANAERGLEAFGDELARRGGAMTTMLSALDFHLDRPRQVLIVRTSPTADAEPLVAKVRAAYLPNRVVVVSDEGSPLEALERKVPLLEGKSALDGPATAFVCTEGNCKLPTSDPDELGRLLAEIEPLFGDSPRPTAPAL